MKRMLTVIAWSLAAALIVSMAIFKITCFDVWWHLKSGEYILSHLTVPTHDIFSYTAQGWTWVTHEWFFEVWLFLASKLAGLTGVILLNALIVLLGFVFTFLTLRRLKIETVIALPLVVLATFLVTFRAFCRPHIVTEALLALYLMALLSYKYIPEIRAKRSQIWLLLVVQLVWANTHSGGILGIALFVGFIATEFVQGLLARRKRWIADSALPAQELLFLTKITAGLLLVSFLNPNLHRALLYPVTITGEPIFAGGVKELQSPLSGTFLRTDFFYAFLVLLGIGLISFLVSFLRELGTKNQEPRTKWQAAESSGVRRDPTMECNAPPRCNTGVELSHLILFLVAALAAALALRNLPIFGVIAVPLVAINLGRSGVGDRGSGVGDRDIPALRRKWIGSAGRVVVVLIPAALLVMVFTRGVNVTNDFRKPAFGYDERIFPVKAADFLAEHEVKGNVFSTMEYNGYFIYRWFPQRKVFIDGRLDVYGRQMFEVYGKMLWSSGITDSIFTKYDINCCILPQPPSNSPAMQNYIGRTLGMRPDWTLIYWDDLALIYVRGIPAHEQLIARNAYHAVLPTLLGLPESGTDLPQLLTEAERAVNLNPASPLALTVLGVAHTRLNQLDEARVAFERVLSRAPSYTEALVALGMVYMREQNSPAAIATFERVVRLEPDNSVALYNLGYSSFRNNQFEKAEKYLLRTLDVNPQIVPAYNLLGDIYQQQGWTNEAIQMWQAALRIDPENAVARSRLESLRRPSR